MTQSASATPPSTPKKPWVQPELVEYGSVAQLTQTGGSTRNEANIPQNRSKK